MSNEFERLSKIAQDEFGVTIKSKHPTGETFESLYGETIYIDRKEKQIEGMAKVIDKSPWKLEQDFTGCNINSSDIAEYFYKVSYRKRCEVIDEFAKRLIDAFPEASPNHRSPCLYYDEYRYIIEELAEELKVCEK